LGMIAGNIFPLPGTQTSNIFPRKGEKWQGPIP
jgi:hypothetical protein